MNKSRTFVYILSAILSIIFLVYVLFNLNWEILRSAFSDIRWGWLGLAFAAYLLTGTIMLVVPAFIVSAIVLGECWLAVEGLGRVLDRTDPSAVEAAE